MIQTDPITLQVIQARLAGIVQEMQNSLFRTGYSTIIRESQDASCAILNRAGEVVARFSPKGLNRYDGRTERGAPVSLTRG